MKKYALKEFIRNIKFNVFIIVQLAFVFAMIVFMISSVQQNLKYYLPLKNVLSKDGICLVNSMDVSLSGKFLNENKEDDVLKYSKYFDEIFYASQLFVTGELSESEMDKSEKDFSYIPESDNPYLSNTYSYYKNVIDLYTPLMVDGEWLSEVDNYSNEENVLHAVITENDYGLKVGDVYTQGLFVNDSGYKNFKIKIIGVMKSGTRTFGMIDDYDARIKITAKDLYKSYSTEQEGVPLVLFSTDELNKYNCYSFISGRSILKFKDGLSDEEYIKAVESSYGLGTLIEFKEIRENSLKEIKSELTVLAPIIGGIILLVIVSVLSMSAVNTNKQLRNYGIYYMCGCRWKQCAMINTLSILVSEAAAVILAYAGLKFADVFGFLKNTVVTLGTWQLLGCLCVMVITLIAALIMPVLIIGKSTPREIIKSK